MQSAESFPGLEPWHPCSLMRQADPAVVPERTQLPLSILDAAQVDEGVRGARLVH
jgi:hypothetical protein